jgi:CheY-like chemotaxis protein
MKAIDVLERRRDIELVITDINMPGSMDGLRLAAAIRDRWPPIHLIVVTGVAPPRSSDNSGSKAIWGLIRSTMLAIRVLLRHMAGSAAEIAAGFAFGGCDDSIR